MSSRRTCRGARRPATDGGSASAGRESVEPGHRHDVLDAAEVGIAGHDRRAVPIREGGDERVRVADPSRQLDPGGARRELQVDADDVDRPVLELPKGGSAGLRTERALDRVEDLAGGDRGQPELELVSLGGLDDGLDDGPGRLLTEGADERLRVEDDGTSEEGPYLRCQIASSSRSDSWRMSSADIDSRPGAGSKRLK
jgi:hypothetical protein